MCLIRPVPVVLRRLALALQLSKDTKTIVHLKHKFMNRAVSPGPQNIHILTIHSLTHVGLLNTLSDTKLRGQTNVHVTESPAQGIRGRTLTQIWTSSRFFSSIPNTPQKYCATVHIQILYINYRLPKLQADVTSWNSVTTLKAEKLKTKCRGTCMFSTKKPSQVKMCTSCKKLQVQNESLLILCTNSQTYIGLLF